MFTKANINWNTNQLVKMISNGRITFDNAVQRGLVWKDDQKSLLIHSMLTGYPIPALYARKGEDKTYDMLDGKQRCSTIVEFRNDEFALTELSPIVTDDGEEVDITGKTYSELSEDFKDIINNYSLTVYYFENMADDEVAEMFYRLNNGKPLSGIVMTRCKAKSLKTIMELGQHKLFKDNMTEKAMGRYTNEDIVIKSYMMLTQPRSEICLDTKVVRPMTQTVEFTDKDVDMLNAVFDRLVAVHAELLERAEANADKTQEKIAKRMLVRTHMISLVPIVWKSIKNQINVFTLADWVEKFFTGKAGKISVSEKYNSNSSNGSNHHAQVEARWSAMEDSYGAFIAKEKKEKTININNDSQKKTEKVETAEVTTEEEDGQASIEIEVVTA